MNYALFILKALIHVVLIYILSFSIVFILYYNTVLGLGIVIAIWLIEEYLIERRYK